MDPIQYLPQVAGGGTLLIIGYGFKMLLDYITQRRTGKLEEKKFELAEDTQQITDAAAANSILLASLQAVREENLRKDAENARKDAKIEALETRNAEKDIKIEGLQKEVRELRAQVHVLLQRLDGVDFELDDLRDNH
jgi:predicted RNase H-like nuclease (RuvC/YqgF family)